MITHRDTVSWDRPQDAGNNATGDPVRTSAPGFPTDVIGMMQHRSARSVKTKAGDDVERVAMFYSDSYLTGLEGDVVTDEDGQAYVVVGVTKRKLPFSSMVSHARYELAIRGGA